MVALPVKILVRAADDDIDCEPACGQHVERGEEAGGAPGAITPGRCATIGENLSVSASMYGAVAWLCGQVEE